ncbi:MAG: methionyl-tRNA formyltransferase [Saprospiraceae bacterium]|nr:methionyl-tRNA formyltransferase [Saprospiraceae bacterium]
MKIVFFGTPEFAATSLNVLISEGFEVVCVVTAKDHMGGRGGKQLLQSEVKKLALEKNLPVLQPEKLKNEAFIESLSAFKADIFVVVAFRMLPEIVWSMPPLGSYNLHGSLLPCYRGAAPIHWAVINGEIETGVTVFKLKHDIDTGDILLQESLPILPEDTTGAVYNKMQQLGAKTLVKALKMIQSGNYSFKKQDGTLVSHAPKIFHADAEINFTQNVGVVFNFIRGMNPFPGAWTFIDGKECKILSITSEVDELDTNLPGTIITDHKKWIKIKSLGGFINVSELKMQGGKALKIHEFLAGNKITNLFVGNQIIKM